MATLAVTGLAASEESAGLAELEESVVLEELEALAESVAPDARVVSGDPVVRAESAGATGQRSGSTTPSTAAERLMEIEPLPIDSAE